MTQHEPRATMWNRISRWAPGCSASASSHGFDSNANGSESSDRKKSAPSSRSASSAASSTRSGVAAKDAGASVMGIRPAGTFTHPNDTHREKGSVMAEFPPLQHVALTVRDLSVSVPWYEALLD